MTIDNNKQDELLPEVICLIRDVAEMDEPPEDDERAVRVNLDWLQWKVQELINERQRNTRPTPSDEVKRLEEDAIRDLIKRHAEMLDDNPYCYFELAYTRRTEWMAWICSNHRDDDPDRKILAKGQGETPEEACRHAIAALSHKEEAE